MDLFTDEAALERERRQQETILEIRRKYGKNAILKGVNFEEGATTIERNKQIGGHKA
jgi:DNA polymerase V